MSRLVKCYGYCNHKYPASQMKKFKNANHCHDCYDMKVKEVQDRENLYDFINKTFNLSFPSGLMLKQIKEFREERNYTYKNIMFTIDYITRIKKMTMYTKSGIALVPHFYDEMIEYYKELQRRRETTFYKEPEVITVTLKNIDLENHYRKKKMIDMENLLGGNEND